MKIFVVEQRDSILRQDIAGDGAFSLVMNAEFESPASVWTIVLSAATWKAGLMGQALYLEAEAAGVRGTGIGCSSMIRCMNCLDCAADSHPMVSAPVHRRGPRPRSS